MQFIPTKIHGAVDYLVGALLIAAPWLFDFADGGVQQWIPIALGAGVILYSLLTNYELGIMRVIPMPIHLLLDIAGGAFLAASPWLFGFSDEVWIPHIVVGLIDFATAAMTRTQPEDTIPTYRETGAATPRRDAMSHR